MSLATLSSLLTAKAVGIATASAVVVGGAVALPEVADDRADGAVQEQEAGDDDAAEQLGTLEEDATLEDDADGEGGYVPGTGSETADAVHEVIEQWGDDERGREFGAAVSDAARGDNGPDEIPAGQSEDRRPEDPSAAGDDAAAPQAGDGAANADNADVAEERRAEGEDGDEDGDEDDDAGEPDENAGDGLDRAGDESGAERP